MPIAKSGCFQVMVAQGVCGTPSRAPSATQRAPAEALRPPPVTRGRRGAEGGPQPAGPQPGPPAGHDLAAALGRRPREARPGPCRVTQPASPLPPQSSFFEAGRIGQRFPECCTAKGKGKVRFSPGHACGGDSLSMYVQRDCAAPTAKRGRTKSSCQGAEPFKISNRS